MNEFICLNNMISKYSIHDWGNQKDISKYFTIVEKIIDITSSGNYLFYHSAQPT